MSKRTTRAVAAAVALLVLAAGLAYTFTRSTDYKSEATMLLAPKRDTPRDILSSVLDSFGRSGTGGTYVEMISSADTLRSAEAFGTTVAVRAIPDTRTIQVTVTGPEERVQPTLERVIRAAQERQVQLRDVWELQILESPSAPSVAGISTAALLGATALMALLSALFLIVVLGRYRLVAGDQGEPGALGAASAPAPAAGELPPARQPVNELEQAAEVRVHFDLESFRYVRASPTTVLLQVTGYWRSDHPRELGAPRLLLHDGKRMHPLAPLQAPDGKPPESGPETPLWRGSYAAPVEIFERHERVALRAGPGVVIGLPHPIEQGLLSGAARPEPVAAPNGTGPEHEHGDDDGPPETADSSGDDLEVHGDDAVAEGAEDERAASRPEAP